MFIVWGQKEVHRAAGHVADFCVVCRKPQVFQLFRIGRTAHLCYISLGLGALVGFDRRCTECGNTVSADVTHYRRLDVARAPLDELVASTFPNLSEVWSKRLEIESEVRSNLHFMSASNRAWLIREPFVQLAPQYEARFATLGLDKDFGYTLLGLVLLYLLVPLAVSYVAPSAGGASAVTLLLLSVVALTWQWSQVRVRYLHRVLLPLLVRSLRPLQPTDAELDTATSELGAMGWRLAHRIDRDKLRTELRPSPVRQTFGSFGQV